MCDTEGDEDQLARDGSPEAQGISGERQFAATVELVGTAWDDCR